MRKCPIKGLTEYCYKGKKMEEKFSLTVNDALLGEIFIKVYISLTLKALLKQ